MATDIEESDTDDHEKPTPPKRQCTRLIKTNETALEMAFSGKEDSVHENENIVYDDAERLAREKLKRWQACQVAKGYVDNTINKVLENYIMGRSACTLDESRYQVFRTNDMENTAVMMAIRNHGLVQSTGLSSQSSAFYNDNTPDYWINNEDNDFHCTCSSTTMQGLTNFQDSLATTSANTFGLNKSNGIEPHDRRVWDFDKIDEDDQQENILERAVAEAIKKKGLSVLSVDYG